MKRFKNMTAYEFNLLKNNAKDTPLSPFAEFHIKNRGVQLLDASLSEIDKWEAFDWNKN